MSAKKTVKKTPARKPAPKLTKPEPCTISAADAVFSFAGMLSTLPVTLEVGSSRLSSPLAELAGLFTSMNGITDHSANWPNNMRPVPIPDTMLKRIKTANEVVKNKTGSDEVNSRRSVREAPGPHFKRLASVWSALLGCHVSPEMAVIMMTALKLVREAGGHEPDNMLDAEGYSSLHEEVRKWNAPRNTEECGVGNVIGDPQK